MDFFKFLGNLPGMVLGQVFGGGGGERRARGERDAQRASYERQLSETRAEQGRINERLSASRNASNAGVARANRSRARGGIFGDSATPTQPTNPRLG